MDFEVKIEESLRRSRYRCCLFNGVNSATKCGRYLLIVDVFDELRGVEKFILIYDTEKKIANWYSFVLDDWFDDDHERRCYIKGLFVGMKIYLISNKFLVLSYENNNYNKNSLVLCKIDHKNKMINTYIDLNLDIVKYFTRIIYFIDFYETTLICVLRDAGTIFYYDLKLNTFKKISSADVSFSNIT